jgi:hypothetical protein
MLKKHAEMVSRRWKYTAIVLGLIVASLAWNRYQTTKALRQVFCYEHRVSVIDGATGRVLRPEVLFPASSTSDLFLQFSRMQADVGGSVTISGVGYQPRVWEFKVAGYPTKKLTLGPEIRLPNEIQITLDK